MLLCANSISGCRCGSRQHASTSDDPISAPSAKSLRQNSETRRSNFSGGPAGAGGKAGPKAMRTHLIHRSARDIISTAWWNSSFLLSFCLTPRNSGGGRAQTIGRARYRTDMPGVRRHGSAGLLRHGANDVADRAHSEASKCDRGADDVMQTRSIRRSEEPVTESQ